MTANKTILACQLYSQYFFKIITATKKRSIILGANSVQAFRQEIHPTRYLREIILITPRPSYLLVVVVAAV
jgi:hypothetical protein